MIKRSIIIVSISLILVSFAFINKVLRLNRENNKLITEIFSLEQDLGSYYFSLICNIQNNDYFLDGEMDIIDEEGSQVDLSSLVKKSSLVFRYTDLHCNECIDKQLNLLIRYADRFSFENILILTHYSNSRNRGIFKRVNAIDYPIYNIRNLDIPMEELGFPYFFVLDKNLQVRDTFLPIKSDTVLTIDYFDAVSKKFGKNIYGGLK